MKKLIVKNHLDKNTCSLCGFRIEAGWNFCPNCKSKIIRYYCDKCHKEISAKWCYCPYCKSAQKKDCEKSNSKIDGGNEWIRNILFNKK